MARKTTSTQNLDTDVAKELEKALDFDLTAEPVSDLDIAASMEDLEAQISQAADELARESRNGAGDGSAKSQGDKPADASEPAPASAATPREGEREAEKLPRIPFKPDPKPEPGSIPMGMRPVDEPQPAPRPAPQPGPARPPPMTTGRRTTAPR